VRESNSNQAPKWAHFIAVGGTGVGALAVLLQEEGYIVTGSDGPLYPPMSDFLDSRGIKRVDHYRAENLNGKEWGIDQEYPDLIIVGNAISRGHVEANVAEELAAKGVSEKMSFAAALAHFAIRDRKSFVVAGTHGKTSTSTQMAWALESLGKEPGFFIGGVPGNFGQGCRMGTGACFVSEGDEYDTAYWDKESKFLHYRPTWVLCTGIEYDHADIFENLAQIEASFHKLITKTKAGWVFVDETSAPNASAISRLRAKLKENSLRFASYGESPDSEYQLLSWDTCIIDPELPKRGTLVKFKTPNWGVVEVRSPLSGKHNALNTVGIVATLIESSDVNSLEQVQEFLNTFKGVKRRQEEIYLDPRCVIIDDFAHHPTAIRETVKAIKNRFPEHKIAAFFEPRSASSARNIFQKEFSECFADADQIYLSPPTKTNIPEGEKLDVEAIVKKLHGEGKEVFCSKNVSELASHFGSWQKQKKQKSVALVMSNGSFSGLHKMLVEQAKSETGKSFGSRSGQTMVEYVLFLALILGVSLGIFQNVIFKKMDEIQANIADKTSDVLSQNTMGIPLSWFDLKSDGNWDAKIDNLAGNLSGGTGNEDGSGAGGGRNGGPGNRGPNGANTSGDGDGDGSGDDGSASGRGVPSTVGRTQSPGPASGGGGSGGGGSGGARGANVGKGSSSEDSRGSVDIKAASNSGGGNRSSGTVSGTDGGAGSASKGGDKGKAEEEKKEAEGVVAKGGQFKYDGRKTASSSRGCGDVDILTLIKILGSLGVILLGAVVMLSGRGGGKNAK